MPKDASDMSHRLCDILPPSVSRYTARYKVKQSRIEYFLGLSRVVTLISLLAALKETCSLNSLHIYCVASKVKFRKNAMQAMPSANLCKKLGETERVVLFIRQINCREGFCLFIQDWGCVHRTFANDWSQIGHI